MVWKPKERELTPEEAVAAARRDLAPYWFGSSPLVAGVAKDGGFTVHPLDPSFAKSGWLFYFIDPTSFVGEATLDLANVWHRRYEHYNLRSIAVFQARYSFLSNPDEIRHLTEEQGIHFPMALDAENLLTRAFNATRTPKLVLLKEGKRVIEEEGASRLLHIEERIQSFLRTSDPGLPLLPLYRPETAIPVDLGSIEFGKGKGTVYSPGRLAELEAGPGKAVYRTGDWTQEEEGLTTHDPKAELHFRAASPSVAIVARTLSRTAENGRVTVEIQGENVHDVYSGRHLAYDDQGTSHLEFRHGRLYHVLHGLPADRRNVSLRFHMANRVPIQIHAIRLSE